MGKSGRRGSGKSGLTQQVNESTHGGAGGFQGRGDGGGDESGREGAMKATGGWGGGHPCNPHEAEQIKSWLMPQVRLFHSRVMVGHV